MLKIFRASCHRCSQIYNCYWVSILSLQITKLPWEMFRRGGSPPTTNWNPGVFLEPRGAHLPRSARSRVPPPSTPTTALSPTTTTTTSPKICTRIVLCSPREEILLCEILLCRSWQSWADGWAVVMNYKSYCYRRGEICHYFPIYNSTRSRIRSVWRNPGYTRWYEILVNYKSYCYRRCQGGLTTTSPSSAQSTESELRLIEYFHLNPDMG